MRGRHVSGGARGPVGRGEKRSRQKHETGGEISITDTLAGERRTLEPRDPPRVGIYACGPTVYSRIHVGNARPYVVFSLLKRFLEHEGHDVTFVANITDINDKIYDAA